MWSAVLSTMFSVLRSPGLCHKHDGSGDHSTLVKPGVGQEAEVTVKWTELPREPATTISGCPCQIPEPLRSCKDIQRLEVDQ